MYDRIIHLTIPFEKKIKRKFRRRIGVLYKLMKRVVK